VAGRSVEGRFVVLVSRRSTWTACSGRSRSVITSPLEVAKRWCIQALWFGFSTRHSGLMVGPLPCMSSLLQAEGRMGDRYGMETAENYDCHASGYRARVPVAFCALLVLLFSLIFHVIAYRFYVFPFLLLFVHRISPCIMHMLLFPSCCLFPHCLIHRLTCVFVSLFYYAVQPSFHVFIQWHLPHS